MAAATAYERTNNERYVRMGERTRRRRREPAPAATLAGLGGSRRSRWSRLSTAVTAGHGGHGRSFQLGPYDGARRSGSGGGAEEAIADLSSIARLRSWRRLRRGDGCPAAVAPGHETFWFFRRPVGRRERLTHERTNERYVCTTERTRLRRQGPGTARRITAITAITAVTTDHGDHCRPRRSRPVMAVTAVTAGHRGHSRPRPNVSDAGSRPRRHEPAAHGTGQGAHGAVRT